MSEEKDEKVDARNFVPKDKMENDQNKNRKKMFLRRKVCKFCVDKNLKIDYKEVDTLRRFITEGGKIIPKRMSCNCSKHQRRVAAAIKVARAVALLPYVKA